MYHHVIVQVEARHNWTGSVQPSSRGMHIKSNSRRGHKRAHMCDVKICWEASFAAQEVVAELEKVRHFDGEHLWRHVPEQQTERRTSTLP